MSLSYKDDHQITNTSGNLSLNEIVERAERINPGRRRVVLGGFSAAALPFFGSLSLSACGGGGGGDPEPVPVPTERMFGFTPVTTSTADTVLVPPGYIATPFAPWGDPIAETGPAFKADATNTAAEQEQQIGDNHDGLHYFGFAAGAKNFGNSSDEGLLVVNHEYINPEYFYAPDTDPNDWLAPFTLEKARKGQAGHGVSVLHIKRNSDGSWQHLKSSPYNRRIHGNTPIQIQGPAAGHALLKTAADPGGVEVLGTLNNCGSGRTPWGTYLTCEENFNGYFGWNGEHAQTVLEKRYGITQTGFGYRWHTADPRFDVSATPNEPNRFGWVVEIDPFAPASKPVKRTALGRFKHEGAECVVAANGKVVVYMGCDERNEYIYKFVSKNSFDAANPTSAANRKLLEEGTLYVAVFEAGATAGDRMGSGRWIALVFGENGLTEANGFTSQADVLIRARQAADRLGATMMDRPEWIAAHPKKGGEVFATLTNNNRRGTTPASSNAADGSTSAGGARPAVDEANPRSTNNWGHILRWNESGGDASATTFNWDIYVLAGQPAVTGERAPSSNITAENLFNSPDGLAFDGFGRLWIQTDGSFSNTGDYANMGNNQLLVGDPQTKEIKRFLVGPSGCEITGLTWTPDRKSMFLSVQHPGEVSNHPRAPKDAAGATLTDNAIARNPTAFSTWPASSGVRPRSAVVIVRRSDGGVIGG
ncbi:hypothetical protein BURK2_02466 [Burkholderiales bacterium]|nr:MAG: PhoX family phosphatase [Burkholderiales bacterium]CAG0992395.1 hypothetical protein BURK2_02466 [Burkholderiales bacterium]